MPAQITLLHSLVVFICLLLTACSTTAPRTTSLYGMPNGIAYADQDLTWKSCSVKITWPETAQPDWGVDLFLAHSVFGPVLSEIGGQLSRWRFHRRAAPDEAGHQFRFLFYSDLDTAVRINDLLDKSEIVKRALAENILTLVYCQSPDDSTMPDIEDTSDPNWSVTMQRQWPAYIMGVSSLWLGLIDEAVGNINPDDDLTTILDQYRQANIEVTKTWQTEAQHALLHHLNAIFGYEPMIINKGISF